MLVAMNAQFYPILLSWCPSRSVLVRNLEKIVEGLIHLGRKSETPFDPAVFLFFSRKRDRCFVQRQKAQGFLEIEVFTIARQIMMMMSLVVMWQVIMVEFQMPYSANDAISQWMALFSTQSLTLILANRFCFQCHPSAFPIIYILCATTRINANEPN